MSLEADDDGVGALVGSESTQQRWVRTRLFDYPSWVPQVARVRSFRSLRLNLS